MHQRGDDAWVFDNPEDLLVGQLSGAALFGVDVTDFLENPQVRAPVTLYLSPAQVYVFGADGALLVAPPRPGSR